MIILYFFNKEVFMVAIISGKETNYLLSFAELEYEKEYVGLDGYLYVKYRDSALEIDTLLSNKMHLNDSVLSGCYEYANLTKEELDSMYFVPLAKPNIA